MVNFFKYLLILCICFGSLLRGEKPAYTIIKDQASLPILSPSLAQRQTLKLRLANGLEAYIISDPEATHAGSVLTVQAGSWDDPEKYPGLAHFLEHMLFLGTEKYPDESDYDRFISEHDGKSNAYTANDYSLYLFSISPSAFEEALDRFSFFFKKPLFNPSGVDRELNAVNQEFIKNFDQDGIRESFVTKALANVQHPFHRFSAGNSTTLSKVTQKTLKEWYQEHYSANLMRLIVYGPYSLETLKEWVVADFKDIPSNEKQPHEPQIPILTEEMQGKLVCIEPVKNFQILRLTWELPASAAHQTSFGPIDVISSILGYEGKGSLLAILRAEGLANNLSSRGYYLGRHHLLFSLSINLTNKGLENIFQVIGHCFHAIQFLQQQDLPSHLFEELKKAETIRYQYQSRENTFDSLMELGGLLVYEDLKSFPESALVPQNVNQHAAHEFLGYLTPERVHLTLLTRHPSIQFDQTEPWMKIPYKIIPLGFQGNAILSQQPQPSHFQLPAPNPFIPQDLSLVPDSNSQSGFSTASLPTPDLLVDHAKAKIYFASDHRFHIPKTLWFFEIKTPAIDEHDPYKVVLADLYIRSLQEALQPYNYPIQLADLSYNIFRTPNGILLSVSGYRDNTEKFFEILLAHLKNCLPSERLFHFVKYSLLSEYDDFNKESPLEQGMEAYKNILFESYSTYQQRAKVLEQVSYGSFLDYMKHLYDQTYTKGLLYGNVSKSQALQIWNKLQNTLSSQSYPLEYRKTERVLVLPAQTGPYVIDMSVKSSAHAAILAIECDSFSFKQRAAQQILAQAMESAFYATLRTKQQTGYLVYSRAEEVDKHLFLSFAVQSATHDPRDLLARFELFIEGFLQEVESHEVTREHFESIRQSLVNTLENTPQNLAETGYLLKNLALEDEGDFDWMSKRIQGLKDLTYEEFLEMTKKFLGKDNKRRLAILVRGTADKDFHYHSIVSQQKMREMSQYTRDMPED